MTEDMANRLVAALRRYQTKFAPILGYSLTAANARQLDLSVQNPELKKYSNHEDYTRTLDHENFIW